MGWRPSPKTSQIKSNGIVGKKIELYFFLTQLIFSEYGVWQSQPK